MVMLDKAIAYVGEIPITYSVQGQGQNAWAWLTAHRCTRFSLWLLQHHAPRQRPHA